VDEVIRRFNASGVRYLVLGGQAMRLAGMPRFSIDWDVFVPPRDQDNFQRIRTALGEAVSEPLMPLGPRGENFVQTFQTPWGIVQFHLGVPGLPDFEAAERRSVVRADENGVPVRCVCGEDLLASKRAAGRPQDRGDIAFLEEKKRLGLL
jgi:hypothetical protein